VAGDTAVVGAVNADAVTAGGGAAYVFERNHGGMDSWGEVTILAPAGLEGGDQFGASVAIWGDTIVVGDPAQDDACVANAACESGAAYVFRRNEGGADNWGLVDKLVASDGAEGDEFGTAVALRGDTIVVGSPFDDDACGSDPCSSGSAYVFERNLGGADGWGEVRKLIAADDAFNDALGTSVAIDGDVVAAGAPNESSAAGAVYLFGRNQGGADQWGQLVKVSVASPLGTLGQSVALDGDRLVAGAHSDDPACPGAAEADCGAAYVFERNAGGAGAWGEVEKLVAANPEPGDGFGFAVAVNGSNVLVGAFQDDGACPTDPLCDSGSASLFRRRATEADLSITKGNGVAEVERLAEPPYVVEVGNAGPEDLIGVTVIDAMDPGQFVLGRTAWSCAPAAGSDPATTCPAGGDAADLAAGVGVDIVAGDSLSFTIVTQIESAAAGPISNTARVWQPGNLDPAPGNDSASDSDFLLTPGACGFFEERVVGEQTIDTPTEIAACDKVTLGPNLEVVAPGLLVARAGLEIVLAEDVSFGTGADITLIIDPSLQP
jgi:hypothetical protein